MFANTAVISSVACSATAVGGGRSGAQAVTTG
jgi:hypothetical protein